MDGFRNEIFIQVLLFLVIEGLYLNLRCKLVPIFLGFTIILLNNNTKNNFINLLELVGKTNIFKFEEYL